MTVRNGVGVQLLDVRTLDDRGINNAVTGRSNGSIIVGLQSPKPSIEREVQRHSGSMENCVAGGICVVQTENSPLFPGVAANGDNTISATTSAGPTGHSRPFFTCSPVFPPQGLVADFCFVLIIIVLLVFYLAVFVGTQAEPGGHIFNLIVVIGCCWLGGELAKLLNLHPFAGMLVVGFALRNVPHIDLASGLNAAWSSTLRTMGLGVCLARASLGINPQILQEMGEVCGKIGVFPCICETIVIAVVSHFLLGFPWLWGFLTGSILSGEALAVLIPTMLFVKNEQKRGLNLGIPTLIISAASLDNVVVLTAFGVFISVVFHNDGNVGNSLLHLVEDLIAGIVFSILLGVITWFIPAKPQRHLVILRVIMLYCGCSFALFKAQSLGLYAASILGSVLYPFIASVGWRKRCSAAAVDDVYHAYSALWVFFMPTLVGLSGAELKLQSLDMNITEEVMIVILSGMGVRFAVTMVVLTGSKLNVKERVFVSLSGLVKATIQGAFGSIALDFARGQGADMEKLGSQVLTITTISVLLTAPFGAIVIRLLAPRLLAKESTETP